MVKLCGNVQRGMSELQCEKERNGWLERKVKELEGMLRSGRRKKSKERENGERYQRADRI